MIRLLERSILIYPLSMRIRNIDQAHEYFRKVGLLEELRRGETNATESVKSVVLPEQNMKPISPDLLDLARLHLLISVRGCINVLEFGSGFSSLVIADALRANSLKSGGQLPLHIRRENPWQLDSIDESEEWLNVTKSRIPFSLQRYVNFHYRHVSLGTFNDRPVTYYQDVPNKAYDLIYIDGPSQYAPVESDWLGFNTTNPGRMPMSADILRVEHFLQPGTLVVFDGRTANAKFFELNVQKKWKKYHSDKHDQTLFVDCSQSLGKYNDAFLQYWGKVKF